MLLSRAKLSDSLMIPSVKDFITETKAFHSIAFNIFHTDFSYPLTPKVY